jgi:bifunctional polynucleotide phosphatase/kinase
MLIHPLIHSLYVPTEIHPFFTLNRTAENYSVESGTANFRWHYPGIGYKHTCLHGTNLSPKNLPKIAAFDLDGTLIRSRKKGESWNNTDWAWWHSEMPMWLKTVHEKG